MGLSMWIRPLAAAKHFLSPEGRHWDELPGLRTPSSGLMLAAILGLSLGGGAIRAADAKPSIDKAALEGVFADVPPTHFAYAAVDRLTRAGADFAYGDTCGGSRRVLTRYEFAVAVQRLRGQLDRSKNMPQPSGVLRRTLTDAQRFRAVTSDLVRLGREFTRELKLLELDPGTLVVPVTSTVLERIEDVASDPERHLTENRNRWGAAPLFPDADELRERLRRTYVAPAKRGEI